MRRLIVILFFIFLTGCATQSQMRQRVAIDYGKRVDPTSIADQGTYRMDFEECCAQAVPYRMEAEQAYVAVSFASGSREAQRQSDRLTDRGDQVFGNCMLNRGYKLLW